jgi:hypothetical protein
MGDAVRPMRAKATPVAFLDASRLKLNAATERVGKSVGEKLREPGVGAIEKEFSTGGCNQFPKFRPLGKSRTVSEAADGKAG